MVADFRSLIIYIGSFLISSGIAFIYQHTKVRKEGIVRRFVWITLIISVPVIVAGRRYNVGFDYMVYLRYFSLAKNMSLKEVINTDSPLFFLLLYFLRRMFETRYIFLIISYLTLYICVKALLMIRGRLSVPYVLLLYYFAFYAFSLNGIRQALAISLVLLGCIYLIQNKYKQYIICSVIAVLIHNSSLVSFLFWVVWMKPYKTTFDIARKTYRTSDAVLFIMMFATAFISPLIYRLISLLVSNVGAFRKYQHLLVNYNSGLGVSLYSLLLFLPGIILYDIKDNIQRGVFNICTLFVLLGNLGYFGYYTYRTRYYPYIIIIVFAGYLVKKIKRHRKTIGILIAIYYLLVIVLHDFVFEAMRSSDIFPYKTW